MRASCSFLLDFLVNLKLVLKIHLLKAKPKKLKKVSLQKPVGFFKFPHGLMVSNERVLHSS